MTFDKKDVSAIACLRVQDTNNVISGSVKKLCSKCQTEIWISPANLKVSQEHPNWFLICLQCLATMEKDKSNDIEYGILPESLTELYNWAKRN